MQQVKLLGGFAPTISMEQLAYDCRLLNAATRRGPAAARLLRDLHADSDSALDPQAYVLRPEVVLDLSRQIVADQNGPFSRSVTAARATIEILRRGAANGELMLDERETDWLDTLESQLETIPADEAAFTAEMLDECEKLDPRLYDLAI